MIDGKMICFENKRNYFADSLESRVHAREKQGIKNYAHKNSFYRDKIVQESWRSVPFSIHQESS
jgi:hypothetical protein